MDITSKEEGGKYRELTLISQVGPKNHIPNTKFYPHGKIYL